MIGKQDIPIIAEDVQAGDLHQKVSRSKRSHSPFLKFLNHPALKTKRQIDIIAEVPYEVAAAQVIEQIKSSVADHELIHDRTGHTFPMHCAGVLGKKYGKHSLTR